MISMLLGSGGRSNQAWLENPSNPLDDGEAEVNTARTDAGVRVNREAILGHPAVWGAICKVSRAVGILPVDIYRYSGEDELQDKQHPLHRILSKRPDVELSPFVFKQKLTADAMGGNAYAYVWRDRDRRPLGLWPLNPELTCPVRMNNRLYYGTVLPITNEVRKLDAANVVHIKGLSFDAVEGYDVVTILRNAFALGLGQRKYRGIYFKNNGKPNVVVEAPAELDDEARNRLMASFRAAASGLENAHRAVLLEEGVKLHEYGATARDSQLLDGEEHELVQIANIYGIPPSWLGAKTNVSYKSLEQDTKLFWNNAVLPWIVQIEEELNEKLLTPEEKAADSHVIKFDRNEFEWADMQTRFAAYNLGISGGWLNRDEVRRWENLNAIPGGVGSEFLVPLNMGTATDTPSDPTGDTDEDDDGDPVDPADQQKADDDAEEQEQQDAAKTKAHKEGSNDRQRRNESRQPGSRESARLQVVQEIFARDVARMVGRIATAAARAAKADASRFATWLDGIETEHGRTVADAIDPPARAMGLDGPSMVQGFIGFVRSELLELSGQATSGPALAEAITTWSARRLADPAGLAATIQFKRFTKEGECDARKQG